MAMSTEIITDKSLNWLKDQQAIEKPFMLIDAMHKARDREWEKGTKFHSHFTRIALFPNLTIYLYDVCHQNFRARRSGT